MYGTSHRMSSTPYSTVRTVSALTSHAMSQMFRAVSVHAHSSHCTDGFGTFALLRSILRSLSAVRNFYVRCRWGVVRPANPIDESLLLNMHAVHLANLCCVLV